MSFISDQITVMINFLILLLVKSKEISQVKNSKYFIKIITHFF